VTKDPSPGGRERASGRYMIFSGAIPESVPYAMHMISPEPEVMARWDLL
jgi:hypothetical protein